MDHFKTLLINVQLCSASTVAVAADTLHQKYKCVFMIQTDKVDYDGKKVEEEKEEDRDEQMSHSKQMLLL